MTWVSDTTGIPYYLLVEHHIFIQCVALHHYYAENLVFRDIHSTINLLICIFVSDSNALYTISQICFHTNSLLLKL